MAQLPRQHAVLNPMVLSGGLVEFLRVWHLSKGFRDLGFRVFKYFKVLRLCSFV